jgi:hypothetical protein
MLQTHTQGVVEPSPVPGQAVGQVRQPGQSRKKVYCLSCGKQGVYAPVGPNRVPAWVCVDHPGCDSYVGCHPGTQNALGSLAGPDLRVARMRAHVWIDRLWRGRVFPTRKEVYLRLAYELKIKRFHVAQSDQALLDRLEKLRPRLEALFAPVAAPVKQPP